MDITIKKVRNDGAYGPDGNPVIITSYHVITGLDEEFDYQYKNKGDSQGLVDGYFTEEERVLYIDINLINPALEITEKDFVLIGNYPAGPSTTDIPIYNIVSYRKFINSHVELIIKRSS